MAYISIGSLIALLIGLFGGRIDPELMPLAQTLACVFSANLLYYYGGNAVEAVKNK